MDTAVKRAYIEVRLAKARDDLLTAQDDLEHGHWRGATNRAYCECPRIFVVWGFDL
jgi:hypothetical protein